MKKAHEMLCELVAVESVRKMIVLELSSEQKEIMVKHTLENVLKDVTFIQKLHLLDQECDAMIKEGIPVKDVEEVLWMLMRKHVNDIAKKCRKKSIN